MWISWNWKHWQKLKQTLDIEENNDKNNEKLSMENDNQQQETSIQNMNEEFTVIN